LIEVLSDTMLVVVAPPHGAGLVDVVVHDPAGDSAPLVFEYGPQPSVVVGLTPTSGRTQGGTPVTLSGTGFTGAIGVVFAGLAGTDFTVVNDTTISVVTPAQAPGVADVIVLDAGGDSEPLRFEFVPVAPDPVSPAPSSPVPDPAVSPPPGIPELPATGVKMSAFLAFAPLPLIAGGVLVLLARRRIVAAKEGNAQ
jgi:LPXTG-motif cell wall-anchored protein